MSFVYGNPEIPARASVVKSGAAYGIGMRVTRYPRRVAAR